MTVQSRKMKRRAAVAAGSALLCFVACLAGIGLVSRVRDAITSRSLILQPMAARLSQVPTPSTGNWMIIGGRRRFVIWPVAQGTQTEYQRELEESVRTRRDIMAAVVVGANGQVWAAYRSPAAASLSWESLAGMDLTPLASTFPFGFGGPPAYGPPGAPYGAYGPGGRLWGPPGLPPGYSPPTGRSAPAPYFVDPSLRSPEVEEHLRGLMLQPRPPNAPGWTPRIQVEPIYNRRDPSILIGRLFVLPQWNESTLAFAAFNMGPIFAIGAVLSLFLYWLILPWWVYLDARPRTEKAVPLAILVLLTNFLGWLTYLVIRPEADRICPICVTLLEPGFRLCPHCGWSGALRCRQCGRGVRSDWRFCPYCETPRPEVDQAASGLAAPPGPASIA